jgi:hypothetical protein
MATACNTPLTITTHTPTRLGVATHQWMRGTIDVGPPASCDPPTPPAPAFPAAPGAGEALVGYQDWRNTVTPPQGAMCTTSRAKRWHGLMVFDMAAVRADLAARPHKTLSGTLTYRIGSFLKVPPSTQGIDLCVRTVQLASGYETPSPFAIVELDPLSNGFPSSAPSRLGALLLPDHVPLGQITYAGATTVDPAGPNPTVTVDVSVLLSDWAETFALEPPSSAERNRFGVAFLPFGPTIPQLGLTASPPTPVPPARSAARCTSILREAELRVRIGR